jgi:serine/threonine protein kinase/tetratricopeptide (TPR) repeat protein
MNTVTSEVKSIFGQALAIDITEERIAYLDKACNGDAELRAEVDSLLEAFAQAGDFMKHPEATRSMPTRDPEPTADGPGTVIGPYKLLQQIGEGGFGIVYMAEQDTPVRRKVALKIIKPGMDSAQIIARFESERQALALMDHPNIAKVFDAGTTDTGRPYFVMELVRGVPVTEFCDENHLSPEDRLELFIDICHAIQHAHHKGVIHRDVKPTNVMVTLHDGVPVVKVIDFGVAKATMQKLTEKTLFTAYGQMIGSPAYMSPEQAEMSGLDIDTRTDVYSLGVLLYELLTGTTPLEVQELREAGYAELQRMICEEEAPRPSNRLSSLGDSATVAAGNRGLDVHHLINIVAGDLDWIAMKALEKDRKRRYDTPGGLADDVRRYLRHEPILARPPSAKYRLKKFTQRNRAAVLCTTVVVIAVLIGLLVSSWQAVRASNAEAAALAALRDKEVARASEAAERHRAWTSAQHALASAQAEKHARLYAQTREGEKEAVLNFVEEKILSAARPEGKDGGLGHDVSLRRAIEAAVPFVEQRFTRQPLIEARLRMTLATSFFYLGDLRKAVEQCDAAYSLFRAQLGVDHPDTLVCATNLANCYQGVGRTAEALKLREETLPLQQTRLGCAHPKTLYTMNNLANSYCAAGRHLDAMHLFEKTFELMKAQLGLDNPYTLGCMNNLANSYHALGGYDEALRLREQNLLLRKARLGADHPDTLQSMYNVAISYYALGRHTDALTLCKQTVALRKAKLGPDHPETLECMQLQANCLEALDRHCESAKLREQVLPVMAERLGADHRETLQNKQNLGNSYYHLHRYADALKVQQEVLSVMKAKFGPDDPDTLRSMWGVADALERLGRADEALPLIDDCLHRADNRAAEPSLVPNVTLLRLRLFSHKNDVSGCRQTAEAWEKRHRRDVTGLYVAALLRAGVAGVIQKGSGDFAQESIELAAETDRAMDWLTQAVGAGFMEPRRLKRDEELEVLRDRPDFKQLAAELETKAPRGRPGLSLRTE